MPAFMSTEFSVQISGMSEIKQKLLESSPKLAEKLEKMALRQGAKHLQKAIKNAAPVKTGRLKRAVKIRNSKINRLKTNGTIGLFVSVYPGKNRKDPKGAWYGRFVENGYKRGSKAVSGREAVSAGLMTESAYQAKKKASNDREEQRRKAALKRGKTYVKRTAAIKVRHGGEQVEGVHFIQNTFSAEKEKATKIVLDAGELAMQQVANQLGLGG